MKTINKIIVVAAFMLYCMDANSQSPTPLTTTSGSSIAGPYTVNVRELIKYNREHPEGYMSHGSSEGDNEFKDPSQPLQPKRTQSEDSGPGSNHDRLPFNPSPTYFTEFTGRTDDGGSPPDTHGAVGPNHLMSSSISNVDFRTKYGADLGGIGVAGFFSSIATDINDTRVLYDPVYDRWMITATANINCGGGLHGLPNSMMALGVSKTGDPLGDWWIYGLDVDNNGSTPNCSWIDYPYIGANRNWIVITGYKVGSSLTCTSCSSGGGSRIFVVDKVAAYSGTLSTFNIFDKSYYKLPPANCEDASVNNMFLVGEKDQNSGGVGHLIMYTISGTASNPSIDAGQTITGSFSWGGGSSCFPQPGGNNCVINTPWVHNALYRKGYVWVAHSVGFSLPTRNSVQFWQFDPYTLAVAQQGLVDDPINGTFYVEPSLSVNQYLDVLIGYTVYSSTAHPSAGYSWRYGYDAANAIHDPFVYEVGDKDNFSGRWGDESATQCDPNGTDLWTVQETITPSFDIIPGVPCSNCWITQWARIGPAAAVCQTDIVISTPVINSTEPQKWEASHSITASSVINSTSDVAYDAAAYIILNPGFKAENTGLFRAYIEGCAELKMSDPQTESSSAGNDGLVMVSPNPFSSVTNMLIAGSSPGLTKIEIYNLSGKLMKVMNFDPLTLPSSISIDLGNIPSGLYLWNVFFVDRVEHGKIVKTQ